jgi:hypothetical protein
MGNINVFHVFAAVFAAWVNRHQQAISGYLIGENRVFSKERLGHRLSISDNDRRRLVAKAKVLGREVRDESANLVTQGSPCAWYGDLIARKWTRARQGPCRSFVSKAIADLVLRLTCGYPARGYDRSRGALANLGYQVLSSIAADILKRHGIQSATKRSSVHEAYRERMILFGERSFRRVLRDDSTHDHSERNHQGENRQLLEPTGAVALSVEPVQRRGRTGGMLNYNFAKPPEYHYVVYRT